MQALVASQAQVRAVCSSLGGSRRGVVCPVLQQHHQHRQVQHGQDLPGSFTKHHSQVVCRSSSSSAAPSSDNSHAGHAVLHDFCMTLPYGAIAILGGVASLFLGSVLKPLALPLVAAGAATLLFSVLSLKCWKQASSSAPYTLLSAAASGAAAYLCFPLAGGGLVGWVAGGLTAVSAAACLFCLYNVVAGGNPPRKGTH